jgi:Flp pilus assembly CpaF family ATPase
MTDGEKQALEVEELAKVIFNAMARQPNTLVAGKPSRGQKTLIDGQFYLFSVATRVLNHLRSDK